MASQILDLIWITVSDLMVLAVLGAILLRNQHRGFQHLNRIHRQLIRIEQAISKGHENV